MDPTLYNNSANAYTAPLSGGVMIFYLLVIVVFVVASWKIFEKAGKPGWHSIIPFYNMYQMFLIAGLSGWWFLAMFVPFLNIVAYVLLGVNLAHAFGKSTAWGVFLLVIFGGIGHLILGFGSAKYQSSPAKKE